MSVDNLNELSDHAPVSISIKTGLTNKQIPNKYVVYDVNPKSNNAFNMSVIDDLKNNYSKRFTLDEDCFESLTLVIEGERV